MPSNLVLVKINLFAAYQEAYGVTELQWEFPCNTPVRTICDRMISDHPQLSKWRDVTRFGINLMFVDPDTVLNHGDEVVIIPPVSGG